LVENERIQTKIPLQLIISLFLPVSLIFSIKYC
jgi:hypothetical protein